MLKLAGLSPHLVEVLGALGSARSGSRTEDSTQQPDEGLQVVRGPQGRQSRETWWGLGGGSGWGRAVREPASGGIPT